MMTLTKTYITFGAMMTASVLTVNVAHATGTGSLSVVETTQYTNSSFSTIFERITNSFGGVTGLISMFAYLTGVVFAFSGILKLKDHVQDPEKHDLKSAAMRLVAGGALFALPFIMQTMQSAIGGNVDFKGPVLRPGEFEIKK